MQTMIRRNRRLTVHEVTEKASNSTLRVMFAVSDPESGISEYYWAAGTTPGGTDVFNFTRVNSTLLVERSGLALKHNTTYFVSFVAINRAGFGTIFEDENGVRVLCQPPDVSDVIVALPGAKDFDPEVGANDTKVTANGDEICAKWTTPPQDVETKSEFCVGSRPDVADDIVECVKMTNRENDNMEVTFKDGRVTVTNHTNLNVSDLIAAKTESQRKGGDENETQDGRRSGIHLEPGKTLHYHIRLCNGADKCTEKPLDKVQVMDAHSRIIPPGRSDSEAALLTLDRRRKRAIDADGFEVRLHRNAVESTTLIIGEIHDGGNYRSDSSPSYKPYIVDVEKTISMTSRFLRNRIEAVLKPTFFVSTVGQREMNSAVQLEVDLKTTEVLNGTYPQLIYWNTNSSEWHLAYFTCFGQSAPRRSPTGRFSTAVCRTQSGAATSSGPSGIAQRFLRFETQFAVALVRDELANRPPQPVSVAPLHINGTEEPMLARLLLAAVDPEDDAIRWAIDAPPPQKGRAAINATSGLITYRPFLGAVGPDQVRVRVTDRPDHPAIPARAAWMNVSVELSTRVNAPRLLVAVDGKLQRLSFGPFEDSVSFAVMRVYKDQPEYDEVTPVDIYSLDLDEKDNVSFSLSNNSLFRLGKVSPVTSQLNTSTRNIPNDPSWYSWTHVPLLYGEHEAPWTQIFSLIAVDGSGQTSRPLRFTVNVVEDARCGVRWPLVIGVVAACCAGLAISSVVVFRWGCRLKCKCVCKVSSSPPNSQLSISSHRRNVASREAEDHDGEGRTVAWMEMRSLEPSSSRASGHLVREDDPKLQEF